MVELSPWIIKIGLVTGVCLFGYFVVKIIASLLADVVTWSSQENREKDDQPTDAEKQTGIHIESTPGLHLLSDYGAEHRLVDKRPSERTIRTTIRSLDWLGGFHQVLLVTPTGDVFEVGGSLDPSDGLSSAYGNSKKGTIRVIDKPPRSVEHMEELMISFYRGDGQWERLNVYD
ncbi:MAG: hypothetical protein QNJ00_00960 [Woeseiaceae bacterium]|nr:hypothetical protein [Woeseiaceae bacterium]